MSNFYTTILIVCSVLTAALTAKPIYSRSNWNYLQNQDNRERFIFWISLLTLVFTQFKSCDDSSSAAKQQKDFNDTLANRELRYTHRVDSMSKDFSDSLRTSSNNTTQILAGYGYKVDSLNNIIVKDTGKKGAVVNNFGAVPKLVFTGPEVRIKKETDTTYTFEFPFKATGAACDSFDITMQTTGIYQGHYIVVDKKSKVLSVDNVVSTNGDMLLSHTILKFSTVSRYFFLFDGTYNNKQKVFSAVLTYNVLDSSTGYANPQILEEVREFLK